MDESAETFAIGLARQAGDIMREHFRSTTTTWKSDNSPLTVADEAVNEMVIKAVLDTYPEHAILGEEQSYGDTAAAEFAWVCDPIDGTLPFSHGIPTFVFSLGLVHRGDPILGVLYDPMSERLVTARKGRGTFLNGEPAKVGNFPTLDRAVINVESPSPYTDGASLRKGLWAGGAHAIQIFSIGYAALLLAHGEIAGAVYTNRFPWDGCAADIIIREAGGRFTSLHGRQNRYNGPVDGFLATSGQIHDEILQLIKEDIPDPI